MAASKQILVYGGKGALGSCIIKYFKAKNWWVANVDATDNEDANANIVIDLKATWTEQDESITKQMQSIIGNEKLDAIVCVAGGWAGGNASSKDLVKNSELMWKQSVWTSVISAGLASKFLKEDGILTLTGAQPATKGTAGMIGYGMAKAAVHQLIASLVSENSGLPKNAWVAAILPVTLDTPLNRKFMPKGDTSKWTPLDYVSELLYNWTENKSRPENGSLIQLITEDFKTKLNPIKYKM